MAWASKSYTFSASTTARASEVNDNFDDMVDQLNIAMPTGGIIAWSGSVGSIPSGWYLCDGNNSTPDLRGRMIIGAGGSYSVGASGGDDEVTLAEANLPANAAQKWYGTRYTNDWNAGGGPGADVRIGFQDSGSSTPFSILNPYYALAWIMKS